MNRWRLGTEDTGLEAEMERTKTIICDQHRNFREAFKYTPSLESDAEILVEGESGAELIP